MCRQGWFCGWWIALALLAGGCTKTTESKSTSADTSTLGAPRAGETWDVIHMQGSKVGYAHTFTMPDPSDPGLLKTETESRLVLSRFGQRSEQSFSLKSWETTAGKLVRFSTEMRQGSEPQRSEGSVEGAQLLVTAIQGERRQTLAVPWSEHDRGFQAIEQSLRQQPMQPGETRRIHTLMPIINLVARCDLQAISLEATPLLSGSQSLLRIEQQMQIVGTPKPLESTVWCDTQGEILKSRSSTANQETFRTTREVAESRAGEGAFDLGKMSSVLVSNPPGDPHHAAEARYRVELQAGDPREYFAHNPAQAIQSTGRHSAEIIEHPRVPPSANRAAAPLAGPAAGPVMSVDAPTNADRASSTMIQSDDPRIVTLAKQAGDGISPWEVATRLESIVARTITKKNLSQTFASAAETIATGEGDCTEHAVLLAALCRARGIPSRVTTGLVYVPTLPGFAFHMWTEVFVENEWYGLDGTLGQGRLSAGHLKFNHTSLENSNSIASFLPLLQLLGRLKIEIVQLTPRS